MQLPFVKRTLDVTLAALGLAILSPLMLLVAVAIKLPSAGPVFYRGRRVGRFGRPFLIFKFRTMVVNAETLGGSSSGDDDPRITRVGRLLRKTKLDELPQLINVLRGEMSFVGPRPEVQQYVDMYTEQERVLLELRPGITDWASIWNSDEGAVLAGADDPDQAYEQLIRPTKLKLQLAYAANPSLWIDLRILFYTFYAVFARDFVPAEITAVLHPQREADAPSTIPYRPAAAAAAPVASANATCRSHFGDVTELPGMRATQEQLSMLHTRYRMAAELSAGVDVLELACGPGIGLGCLERQARRLTAGDVDPTFINKAVAHYGNRVDVRRLDSQCLPFEDASFDVILLLEAVYFLPQPERFVAEAHRVLRPGGQVLIVSANRERPDFNPSPQSHRYFTARELQVLLLQAGFETELFAAYPISEVTWWGKLLAAVRLAAVRYHLIPGSMRWKTRIKRLVYGRLRPLPNELMLDEHQCADVVSINTEQPTADFKVIYAVGRRAA